VRSLGDLDVAGRRVLVRVDFNVPLDGDGQISDDTRIRGSLPTIESLRERGARLILVSHLGRPKGKVVAELSLAPVAARLSELLGVQVKLAPAVVGEAVRELAENLADGEVLLLENVRFEPGEEANDPQLARELAELAELYVNDAFGVAHRAHASTAGVARLLPNAAGLLLEREVKTLQGILEDPERPLVAIVGGAKVADKIAVLDRFLDVADRILIGGATRCAPPKTSSTPARCSRRPPSRAPPSCCCPSTS
jgi:phosphoglycerate kinase